MGPGQLLQAAFILSVGKGCVENIDDIELGNPGGHGSGAEGGLVSRSIQLVIGQLRNRRGNAPGDGDDGCVVFPHSLHALNDLHRAAGVGNDDPQILPGGIPGLEQLRMPILIDNTRLIQPQKLQVGVLGRAEGNYPLRQLGGHC